MPKMHRVDCKCPFCSSKRGELIGSKNPMFGKHFNHTKETKIKISTGNMGKHYGKESGGDYLRTDEHCKKMSECVSEFFRYHPERRVILSENLKKQWKDPLFRNRVWNASRIKHRSKLYKKFWGMPAYRDSMESVCGRGKKGFFYSEKNSCRIFYASEAGELAAYLKLEADPAVLKYGRCKFSIPYILDGEAHLYHPDIMVEYIDGRKIIIEVKMTWELKHPKTYRKVTAKLLALQDYCEYNSLTCEVWTEKTLLTLLKEGSKDAYLS